MTWRLAKALEQLRREVNAKWPGRKKDSDGTIGDEAHASRSSDHNPWVKDGGVGVVTGMDITHDPQGGCDSYALAEWLRQKRDPRVKYIISNKRICSSETSPWVWRPYGGKNPHDHHVHISVKANKSQYDDEGNWGLTEEKLPETNLPQPKPVPRTLRRGASGGEVDKLQGILFDLGFILALDGQFGGETEACVKSFQKENGLLPDGVVGPQSWKLLLAPPRGDA